MGPGKIPEHRRGLAIPHHQELELRAAKALAKGDFTEAYRLADRRCRIRPRPEAHDYVLRAEALFRLGERRSALGDLAEAISLSPGDLTANRKLLAWNHGRHRKAAATVLLGIASDVRVLRSAIEVLWADGPRMLGAMQVLEDTIHGWAVWPDDGAAEVAIDTVEARMRWCLTDDRSHPLASPSIHAAAFSLPRPPSAEPALIRLLQSGDTALAMHAPPNERRKRSRPRAKLAGENLGVTVILPVYRDLPATRCCLKAVLAELQPASPHQVIIVNDATPEPQIARYLNGLAGLPGVTVVTNDYNLGFVGSVNRALRLAPLGDVILLNADTLPPTGFIDRLSRVARSDPGVGTVVPFSNNAELTSFPRISESNPLPSRDWIAALDRIAARVNAGAVVDIPSGTGFCLYVTGACLATVGELSHAYDKGYFEDVDFSLRARQRGFRSVCAPSIYVGHAGTRSFRAEKAALAIKNFAVLARRFGSYVDECRAFAEADPLRPFRAAIERELIAEITGASVLVSGPSSMADIAAERASRLIASGGACMMLRFDADRSHVVRLVNADGGIPQSLEFDLSLPDRRRALADTLGHLTPSRVEIIDPDAIPDELLDLAGRLGFRFDLVISDGALFSSSRRAGGERRNGRRERLIDRLLRRAERLIAPNAESYAFASRRLPDELRERLVPIGDQPKIVAPRRVRRQGRRLGVVTVRGSRSEFGLVRDLGRAFARSAPDVTITVFGDVADDLRLMATGNVFVTGHLSAGELRASLRRHRITHVLAVSGEPFFGHPTLETALACGLPTAAIDWSGDGRMEHPDDLAIRPASNRQIAKALHWWICHGGEISNARTVQRQLPTASALHD